MDPAQAHARRDDPTGGRTGDRTVERSDDLTADDGGRSATGSTPDAAWVGIDHVQLAIPLGGEDRARAFYVGRLGMVEVAKPPKLAARGGAWFRAGPVEVHVGVEAEFVPARKAHPALVVGDLPAFVERCGLDVTWNDEIEGVVRCHVSDPFGNRIELIDADSIDASSVDASAGEGVP